MNSFERKNKVESHETLSPEKQELLALEKEGRFVFHGSDADEDMLHPRQAIDNESGPDGKPAIFASPSADFAIFHAIVHGENFPQGIVSESGAIAHDDGSYELKFKLAEGALSQLPDSATGFVYVFDKKDFAPIDGRPAEYKSLVPVQPARKIKVSKMDLPRTIGSSSEQTPNPDSLANESMDRGV